MTTPARIRDCDILAMFGLHIVDDGRDWFCQDLDAHERLDYFCFFVGRRYGDDDPGLLEHSFVWRHMTERERIAYNQLCDEREAFIETLGKGKP